MLRRYRFALRPGWWVLHVVSVALIVTMVMLGRWQLTVSEHKHFNVRNFGYALQWWAFSAFTVIMWVRVLRDHARRSDEPVADDAASERTPAVSEGPVGYRRYVPPPAATPSDDPMLVEYNRYLAALDSKDAPA